MNEIDNNATNPSVDPSTSAEIPAVTPVVVSPSETPPQVTTPSVVMSAKWLSAIQPLVTRLGMTAEQVTSAILATKEIAVADDASAEVLVDPDSLGDDVFRTAFQNAPGAVLKKAVKDMRESAKPAVAPQVATAPVAQAFPQGMAVASQFFIPDIPEGDGLLKSLSVSNTLEIDAVTIRAVLEAYRADAMKVDNVPERLLDLMEKHAEAIKKPVGDIFTEVFKFVKSKRYAEVNVDSRFVTVERRRTLVAKLNKLPKAVRDFHAVLSGWNEQLRANRQANPWGMNGSSIYPPAEDVILGSEVIVICLNDIFAGYGLHIAKALAFEAIKVREILDRPELPALTGCATKELMLDELGCQITNADVRAEKNIAKYVLFAATHVPTNLTGGQEGPALEALYILGQSIVNWMNGPSRSDDSESPRRDGGRRDSNEPYPLGGGSSGGRRER